MKIGLVGYGKMGRMIEEIAPAAGFEVGPRFTRERPLTDDADGRRRVEGVRVLVDFSIADAVEPTVEAAAALGLRLVIGTTGWQDRLESVRRRVETGGIGVVYGFNFSIGARLFYRLVEAAARAISAHGEYDPFLQEEHHRAKLDRPSGTAIDLRAILEEAYPGAEIPVTSLRAGSIPGTHRVGFDSAADTLVLEHRARSRRGFADGALVAARWIAARDGFHEFGEVLARPEPETGQTGRGNE